MLVSPADGTEECMTDPAGRTIGPGVALTVVGHSHCACLQGVEADGVAFRLLSFWFIPGAIETNDGQRRFAGAMAAGIAESPPGMPLISSMGGGSHAVLSTAAHPQPFDFVLPEAPDLPLDPEAEILPYAAVRRLLEADVREFLELTEMLATAGRGPVFHVDAPPPVADGAYIRPHMPWEYFPGRRHEISPKWHRYRMWRLNTDIAREHAKRIGVGFIGHPREAEDAEGFLSQAFSQDGVHGDPAYGRLLAARILSVVRDGRMQPGDIAPDPARLAQLIERSGKGRAA